MGFSVEDLPQIEALDRRYTGIRKVLFSVAEVLLTALQFVKESDAGVTAGPVPDLNDVKSFVSLLV